MAEPFSISAGALGVLDVGTRLSKRLRQITQTWKNAPQEMLSLQNELEDLNLVLDEIQACQQSIVAASQHDTAVATNLQGYIREARRHFEMLESSLDEMSRLKKYKKKFQWVREQGKISGIQKQIRVVRERIKDLLVTHNVTKASRIELEIVSIRAAMTQNHNDTSTALSQLSGEQRQQRSDLVTLQDSTQALSASVTEMNMGVSLAFREVTSQMERVEAINSQLQGLLTEFRSVGSSTFPAISFTARRRVAPCAPGCPCHCHSRGPHSSEYRLPYAFRNVVGQLFVGYTGYPTRDAGTCDFLACQEHRRHHARIEARYTFPAWFIWYSVIFVYERTGHANPDVGLVLKNRVAVKANSLIHASNSGDSPLVRRILSTAPSRVNDVYFRDGSSPLYWAVKGGYRDIVRDLLSAGADPDAEDDLGFTPRLLAARSALIQSQDLHSGIPAMLRVTDVYSSGILSRHTMALFGLPGAEPLREDRARTGPALDESVDGHDLNALDALGLNALHWSIVRKAASSVRQLLAKGADPNCRSLTKMTPLHVATQYNAIDCIEALCDGGAKFLFGMAGQEPIQTACYYGCLEALKTLVSHGASLGSLDLHYRRTCLHTAAMNNHISIVNYLLSVGADIDAQDKEGATPLALAVTFSCHDTTVALLARGANYRIQDFKGLTTLHYAATGGDAHTLGLLANNGLPGLDPGHRSADGRSAQDIIDGQNCHDEVRAAFAELLGAIERQNRPLTDHDNDIDDDEDFYDCKSDLEDGEFHDARSNFEDEDD